MSRRNFNDPQYIKWRKAVYARDFYCCQWPNCGSKKRLNAHHIRMWAKYIHLRFEVTNGITLCKYHHDSIWGKEEDHIQFCCELLRNSKTRINHVKKVRKATKKRRSKRKDYIARYVKALTKSKRRK